MNRASVGGTGAFQDPAQLHDQEGHRVRVQAIDICSFVCSLTSTVRERSIKHPSQQNRMSAEGLKAYQPSYMLLPNFNFCPDGPIQLGTIIPAIKGGDLPDPNRPKNSTFRVPVEASLINGKRDFKPWTFDSRRDVKNKAALQASISLLAGVGGHVSGERSNAREFTIDSEHVRVESFRPDTRYLAKALDDDLLRTLARKLSRPPLYMVTGLMVAHGAVVRVCDERGVAAGAGVQADVTPQGVPLNAGVDVEHLHSDRSIVVSATTDPLILAYQIVRLRKKRGGLTDEDKNTWGLFSDDRDCDAESDELLDWEIDWVPGYV
jgi:hypothetical protein